MDLINSYAIVAYVAGPIARCADRLREDLAPGTGHRAHITILPPRPLYCSVADATEFVRQLVAQFEPFDVRLGDIQVFPTTQVIYLSVASGACELTSMHDVLNTGFFEQEEAHKYLPHITLGQQLAPESFERCVEMSRRRWEEFGVPPSVGIETLTLVQQRVDCSWEDLAELALGRVPAVG